MSASDLETLSGYEKGYTPEKVNGMCGNQNIQGVTFRSTRLTSKLAYEGNKATIVAGALQHGLPADYVEYRKLLPAKPTAAKNVPCSTL